MRNLKMHLSFTHENVIMSVFLNFLKAFFDLIGGKNIFLKGLLLGAVALFVFQGGYGATKTWDGGAGTNNWGDKNNWNLNTVPVAGDDVVISGNSRTVNLNVNTPVLASVTINTSGNNGTNLLNISGYTLNANSITINGGANTSRFAALSVGSGTLNCAGNINFSGTATQARLTASGAGLIGIINVAGNFGAGGTFLSSVGTSNVNVTCNGTSNQTIAGYTYYNLAVNNAVGVTLGANITVSNNLTISAGVLSTDVYQITGNTSGIMSMSAGTTLRIGKSVTPYNLVSFPSNFPASNVNLDPTSTIVFQSPAYQTIPSFNYGNLTISCYGQTALAPSVANLTVNGNLTIDANATFSLGYSLTTMTVANQLIDNGTLVFTNWPTKTVTVGGDLSGAGTLDMTLLAHVLNLNGKNNSVAALTTDVNNSVVNYGYSGTGSQQIFASNNYQNLIISGGSAKALQGVATVNNTLSLTSGILTTSPYVLNIANSASDAIVGGGAASFVNGPLAWSLPGNLSTGSTYNYPVGSGSTYLPFSLVNPTTTGAATAQVQAVAGASGLTTNVDASLISKSNSEYWLLTKTGNFTNTSVSLTRPTLISPFDAIGGSSTLTGNYTSLGGTEGMYGVSESNLTGTNQYFVLAQAVPVPQTIKTGVIAGSTFCPGSSVSVPFTKTGVFVNGNIFTAQLSDATGSFVSPVNIGSVTSTISGTILATIPSNTAAGTGYRIRVVSSSPAKIGTDNGVDLTVGVPTAPTTQGALICIGSTATLSASGAVAGEKYVWYDAASAGNILKTSIDNTDNTFTTAIIGTTTNYWVAILNAGGCESSTRTLVTATYPTVSADNQNAAGTNSWIGHVYDGTNFNAYYGSYNESESFNQNFGGDVNCFNITSNSAPRSISTEQFSVRYRMNSTKKGLYVVDMGSDDGGRLIVDGTLLYNNWYDQAYSTKTAVLMNLTGASSLIYEFYENGGGNQVVFQNLTQIMTNVLSANTIQTVALGGSGSAISGDVYGTLPAGIALSGTGYQWTYSTTPGGVRTNIAGATGATFTPNTSVAPFNVAGTYYIYRNAILSSSNNVAPNPYVATSESNACTLKVKAPLQYRSLTSGNWNLTSTWESSSDNGVTWEASTTIPTSADDLVTVQSSHVVTLTAAQTAKSITVNGTLDLGVNTLTGVGTGSLILSNTGVLKIGGPSNIPSGYSTAILNATSTVEYYYAGNQTVYEINYGNLILSGSGTKTLTNTGAVTTNVLTVSANTNFLVNGVNALTPASALINGTLTVSNTASLVKGAGVISFNSGSTYNHNRIGGTIPTSTWNTTSTCLISGATTAAPGALNQSFGNFTWNSVQSGDISLAGALTIVNGNLSVINTGAYSLRLLNGGGPVAVNVGGNFIQTGGVFYVCGTGTSPNLILNILGSFSLSSGTFNMNGQNNISTVNIGGNFTMSGGTFTETNTGTSNFNFNGSAIQTYVKTGGSFVNTINFGIGGTSTVDFGTYVLDGSDGTFNLLAGGTVITAHTGGFAATGATGSVQTTGVRSYSTVANYVYNGVSPQVTGTAMVAANNLTINNAAGVTLSAAATVSGVVTLTTGKLITSLTNLLSVTNTSTSAIVGGSSTSYIKGSLRRSFPINLAAGTNYIYPVGDATYLPFTLNPVTGTNTPTFTVSAYSSNAGGTYTGLSSISTSEYWSVSSTNVTSGRITLGRVDGVSPYDVVAIATSKTGQYSSLGGTAAFYEIANSNSTNFNSNGTVARNFLLGKSTSTSPVINVSALTLNNFNYIYDFGPSAEQVFVVNAANLTADLLIAPANSNKYEVSLSSGTGYQNSLILSRTSGSVANTTIYVRLKQDLVVGNHNSEINLTSGAETKNISLTGLVLSSLTFSATGDYNCNTNQVVLNSTSSNVSNIYWTGPNSFYANVADTTFTTTNSAYSGTYTAYGSLLSGINLLTNGSFENGNTGFTSSYIYAADGAANTELSTGGTGSGETKYAITTLPSNVHPNFNNVGAKVGTYQMVINGASTAGVPIWGSVSPIPVSPNTYYQYTYWLQTVVNGVDGNPSKLQLYANGVAAGPIYQANPNSGVWKKFVYNWYSGNSTTVNLTLINQQTASGGNDFAIDDIVFESVLQLTAPVNISISNPTPSVTIVSNDPDNNVPAGTNVTFNATPTNGGTAPVYQWKVNGVNKGTDNTFSYVPSQGDVIICTMTSNSTCSNGTSVTSNQIVMTVTARTNFWLGSVSTDWSNAANWTNHIPLAGEDVVFASIASGYTTNAVKDLVLDVNRVIGKLINKATNSKKLIIPASKLLTINDSIISYNNNPSLILINASATVANGSMIFNFKGPVYASVEMYSKATWDLNMAVNQRYNWQYFGIPVKALSALPTFYGAYVRQMLEHKDSVNNHWESLKNESVLTPFKGYEVCQKNQKLYTFSGQLINSDYTTPQLAKTLTGNPLYPGQHLLANSYTAAIDIRDLVFGNDMEKTAYIYNTGAFGNWKTAGATSDSLSFVPGQYISIPQGVAGLSGLAKQIPSMSAFLVRINSLVSSAESYVSMNYNSLVARNREVQRVKQTTNSASESNSSTVISVSGENSFDKVWLFTDDDFSHDFDNGFDGYKMPVNALQPQLYALDNGVKYQINAVDDLDNTTLVFQAGQDTEYNLTFKHNDETLSKYAKIYLYDMVENVTVDMSGASSTYSFSAKSTAEPIVRFKILAQKKSADINDEQLTKVYRVNNTLRIQNFSDNSGRVYVYDLLGRNIATKDIAATESINIPIANKTAYVVKRVVGNKTETSKLIIE